MRFTVHRAIGFATLVAVVSHAPGQSGLPQPIPPRTLEALQLRSGTVQSLKLPTEAGRPFHASVVLGRRRVTLALAPFDMRSPGFQLWTDDGQELTARPKGPVITYRGSVVGEPDTLAAATLFRGQLWADIHLADHHWFVQPMLPQVPAARATDHAVYRKRDAIWPPGSTCPGGIPVRQRARSRLPGPNAAALKIAEIAIDIDDIFFARFGKDVARSIAAALRVLNSVDAIYRRDVALGYRVSGLIVRTVFRNVYRSTTIQTRIVEFRDHWDLKHRDVRRDLAHMFTGIGSFTGTVGLAYRKVVCSQRNARGTSFAYGLSKAYSSHANNVQLVAHELGHNWDAGHCNASSSCAIMCSSINGCGGNQSILTSSTRMAILAHKASRSCLEDSIAGGSRLYGSSTCVGSGTRQTTCTTLNLTAGTLRNISTGSEWAFGVQNLSGQPYTVTGFRFLTRSRSSQSVASTCWFYRSSDGVKPNRLAATRGRMIVGTATRFYSVVLAQPQVVRPNERFWISKAENRASYAPIASSGRTSPLGTYTRASGTVNAWGFNTNGFAPAWRIDCRVAASPRLDTRSRPTVGKRLQFELQSARPNSAVLFAFGGSRTRWGPIPLPLSLAPFGAKGCSIVASFDLVGTGSVSNSVGGAGYDLSIPNSGAFTGARFYAQAFVVDPRVNPLGMVFSNGQDITIGNQ